MKPHQLPPVRPDLCDKVHAALVKAGRPVTRSELKSLYLSNPRITTADVQAALDALVAEGLAAAGEEGPVRGRWQAVAVYRSV
jgi:hypothetical protein